MWTVYTGASPIFYKRFSRSSFIDKLCFSILASGPHLGATITSEDIFRSSSIDAIKNRGKLIMDASVVVEAFFGRSRISHKLSLIAIFFRMVHKKKLLRRSSVKHRNSPEDPR